MWRIVVRAAIDVRRERERTGVAGPFEPTTDVVSPDESGIRVWVSALPERQRLAVFLRYYADLDYQAIASALEIEVGTVSATLSQAHSALRRQLSEVRQ